jgi:tetratricopeptide (TPR) repeat protein
MSRNVIVSPEEPAILATVTEFPVLREFRERSAGTSNGEHTVELLGLAARAAWVRGDAAALSQTGRRLFRLPGAGPLAREVLALGDLAAGRLGPPPAGTTLRWAADPALWLPPQLLPELLGEDFGTYRSCAALLERLRSGEAARAGAGPIRGPGLAGRRAAARALPSTLGQLTSSAMALGRWSAATDHAVEGLALARREGQAVEAAGLLSQLAWIAAARGQAADCRRLAAEALAIAPSDCTLVGATVDWALGLLDLSLGYPGRALDRLAPLASSSGSTPVLLLATADLVEAAVRAGRPAAAEPLLAQLDRWVELAGPAWALATTFRCRALLADGDEAEICFQAALEAGGGSMRPFAHARTQLDFGAWLRRQRRWVQAATQLRAARETFERLGAPAWSERARMELLASGAPARWPAGNWMRSQDSRAGAYRGGGVRPAARGRC